MLWGFVVVVDVVVLVVVVLVVDVDVMVVVFVVCGAVVMMTVVFVGAGVEGPSVEADMAGCRARAIRSSARATPEDDVQRHVLGNRKCVRCIFQGTAAWISVSHVASN